MRVVLCVGKKWIESVERGCDGSTERILFGKVNKWVYISLCAV